MRPQSRPPTLMLWRVLPQYGRQGICDEHGCHDVLSHKAQSLGWVGGTGTSHHQTKATKYVASFLIDRYIGGLHYYADDRTKIRLRRESRCDRRGLAERLGECPLPTSLSGTDLMGNGESLNPYRVLLRAGYDHVAKLCTLFAIVLSQCVCPPVHFHDVASVVTAMIAQQLYYCAAVGPVAN
jgi:hypothetical protein